MKIAVIDADLIGKKKHRFPNLCCMKISGYHKEVLYDDVELKMDYNNLNEYDQVYISKVFTDTIVPDQVLNLKNVKYGGTGFFYDKAPKLPYEIEHHMPDYHLYDKYVNEKLKSDRRNNYKYYLDYSIGYITRGCFRHCEFCVNKNYNCVYANSAIEEFLDSDRKKICLLDDNFFGYKEWKTELIKIQQTNKKFQFKQGLDERLLTDEKCKILFESNYDEDYIFAFDNIDDSDIIKSKLNLIRKYTNKVCKFYVFCGYDRNNIWDFKFWEKDIFDMMKRIEILMSYQCIPYIMRYNRYVESPYAGVYKTVAAWCNQPSIFKNKTLREFGLHTGENTARNKYIVNFENDHSDFSKYMDMKYPDKSLK